MLNRKPIVSFCLALVVLAVGARAQPIDLSRQRIGHEGGGRVHFKIDKGSILLRMDDPSGNASLTIRPREGTWDFSRATVLAVDVENLAADSQLRLNMFAATGHWQQKNLRETNAGIGLNPGEKRTLRLLLPHAWKYAAPEGVPGVRTLDTTQISSISFQLQWPFERPRPGMVNCRLSNLRLEGPVEPTQPIESFMPFIDVYGQFIHADWPEKVRSAADLRRNYEREKAQLAATKRPAAWNKYGGWAHGPKLKATGSFRTEKVDGKWWLVDPEGRLFFSHGLDVLSTYNDPLRVLAGKENWFASLPPGAKEYKPTELALRQKYGTEKYHAEYFRTLARRLEAWGMNSIGDWSRPELMELGTTPYTLQLTDFDWKMPRLKASKLKFYDVFDPIYIEHMKTLFARQMKSHPIYARSIDDPMCIGYFIDNELNFGNRGARQTLVDDILRCPPEQAAKQELIKDMKLKYGTIERLNEAWQTSYESWDAMLASTAVPGSEGYHADAQVFFVKTVEQYFSLAREAVKSVAPHRLYLGARFISTDAVRPDLYNACAKYADVLSVNIYAFSTANFPSKDFPDVPVLIGEFQFGLLQRGMFSASLCQAGATPEDRALAYTRFMQGALVHPNIVGAHYFQYRDQPLTGRGDSEAYQIGFVDVADTPYEELTTAARQVGEYMYEYRTRGKLTNDMAPAASAAR